jgi:hypothetical protein
LLVSVSAFASSVQYDARGTIWPNDWHSSGNNGTEPSGSVSAQCRQPAMNEVGAQRPLVTSGREQFADMIGSLGNTGSTQAAAEFGDFTGLFTGFME